MESYSNCSFASSFFSLRNNFPFGLGIIKNKNKKLTEKLQVSSKRHFYSESFQITLPTWYHYSEYFSVYFLCYTMKIRVLILIHYYHLILGSHWVPVLSQSQKSTKQNYTFHLIIICVRSPSFWKSFSIFDYSILRLQAMYFIQ